MESIGEGALLFYDELKETATFRGDHCRSILGIISLKKKYGIETVNNACMRALQYNSISYGAVKRICEKGLCSTPIDTSDDNNYSITTQMIDRKKYSDLSGAGVIEHE